MEFPWLSLPSNWNYRPVSSPTFCGREDGKERWNKKAKGGGMKGKRERETQTGTMPSFRLSNNESLVHSFFAGTMEVSVRTHSGKGDSHRQKCSVTGIQRRRREWRWEADTLKWFSSPTSPVLPAEVACVHAFIIFTYSVPDEEKRLIFFFFQEETIS